MDLTIRYRFGTKDNPILTEVQMEQLDPEAVFSNYLAAFAMVDAAEREAMLRSTAREDIVFSNSGVIGQGVQDLLAHVARFQQRFPGGHFRVNWVRQQHGQVLGEWTQLNDDGSEFITAHSYARLDESGLIAQFAGFWADFQPPA